MPNSTKKITIVIAALVVLLTAGVAMANHSWGKYHWARTSNPFTAKLGDNVSVTWDSYLGTTSFDWSVSGVLDTTIVSGMGCVPTKGSIEVCSEKYGVNGWLGLAQIWVNGSHIIQALAKVNDTYFDNAPYNTPGWRNHVMCQEVGHTLGLDHQNEIFNDLNLGSCMDYTNDPDGTYLNQLSNEHPNQHDYDQLETIYTHLDRSGVKRGRNNGNNGNNGNLENYSAEWGKSLRQDGRGRTSLYERDLGNGNKVFTFVFWAD